MAKANLSFLESHNGHLYEREAPISPKLSEVQLERELLTQKNQKQK